MEFDKPKVFIDLEEYQQLKAQQKQIDDNEMMIAARKITWAIFASKLSPSTALEALKSQGIIITMKSSMNPSWEDVDVKIVNI